MRPPAVIIHGLDHARAAVAPGLAVTLLSAPGAGVYAGVGWWRAIIAAAAPGTPDILDCGSEAGRALEALRGGQKALILRAPAAIFEEVGAVALGCGANLLCVAPPGLDLAERGAERRLAAWLAARGDEGHCGR